MLKRQILIYDDGRKEDTIIFTDNSTPTTIYPKRDRIRHSFLTTFRYKVKIKFGEAVAIVRFKDKTLLMPKGIEVHPKTTIEDIDILQTKSKVKKQLPPNIHTFKSSSSDSVYTVREIAGMYKCNCPGSYRAKDKKCKHIKSLIK